jgi:hypothetical protein
VKDKNFYAKSKILFKFGNEFEGRRIFDYSNEISEIQRFVSIFVAFSGGKKDAENLKVLQQRAS